MHFQASLRFLQPKTTFNCPTACPSCYQSSNHKPRALISACLSNNIDYKLSREAFEWQSLAAIKRATRIKKNSRSFQVGAFDSNRTHSRAQFTTERLVLIFRCCHALCLLFLQKTFSPVQSVWARVCDKFVDECVKVLLFFVSFPRVCTRRVVVKECGQRASLFLIESSFECRKGKFPKRNEKAGRRKWNPKIFLQLWESHCHDHNREKSIRRPRVQRTLES